MAEYIEREKLMEKAQLACVIALCDENPDDYPDVEFADTFAVDLDDICEMDAADVLPVVHGRWERHEDSWLCSECRGENLYAYCETLHRFTDTYCPNCGAKMDLEEE